MQVDLTDQERQYIATAVDAYVRQTGVVNAFAGVVIVQKMTQVPKEPESEDAEPVTKEGSK